MQQRLATAAVQLSEARAEVAVILPSAVADVEHGEPSLFEAGRHDPSLWTGHQQTDVVRDIYRVLSLVLDEVPLARDEVPQLADVTVGAGIERLVAVQQDAARQMRVEVAGDVSRVGDPHVVVRDERANNLADDGLADALLAAKRERGVRLLAGSLEQRRDPSDDPATVLLVSAAHVVPDVRQEKGTVAGLRLDRPSTPHVQHAGLIAHRLEDHVVVLSPLWMVKPALRQRH